MFNVTGGGSFHTLNPGAHAFNNAGTFNKSGSGTTSAFNGVAFHNSGTASAISGTIQVNGGFPCVGAARVAGQFSGTILVHGRFGGDTTNWAFAPRCKVRFDNSNDGSSPTLEAMGRDLGAVAEGFTNNFVYTWLELTSGCSLRLVDQANNSAGDGAEAVYVKNLMVPAGCTLDLNGLHLYARAAQIAGPVVGGTVTVLEDGGALVLNDSTPGAIADAGQVDEWRFTGQAGQTITITVNPGAKGNPATVPPYLEYAEARLLSPLGEELANGSSATAGEVVALMNLRLPSNGEYRVQVRAAPAALSATGNYALTVWSANTHPQPWLTGNHAEGTGAISETGEVDEWTLIGSPDYTVGVTLGTGSASSPTPPLPSLDYGMVRLLDPSGNVIQTAVNVTPGGPAQMVGVPLTATGPHRLQIHADLNNFFATGNYRYSIWVSRIDTEPLLFGQTLNGRIETPYSLDRWTFAAQRGTSVQFDLLNASTNGLVFRLLGPGGAVVFDGQTNDSELVTLPTDGPYALEAYGTCTANEIAYACRLLKTTQTDLALETTFTGQFVGNAQAQLFRITNPFNRPLRIVLDNRGADSRTELYAGFGLPPTRGTFHHAAADGSAASREIVVENAFAGTWYVLVYADTIGTPSDYTLQVTSADLFATKLTPDHGGDAGTALVEIEGAGFSNTAQVSLQGHGVARPATGVTWISSGRLVAELNLASLAPGTYQVVVSQGDSTATLPFEVAGGIGPKFEADIILPNGIGLNTVNAFYVEYRNASDAPMVAPLLAVTGDGFGIGVFSLEPRKLNSSFWAGSRPSEATDRPTFFASGRIPGLLLPGESGRVAVYYLGLRRPFPDRPWELARASCVASGVPPGARIIGWRIVEVPPGSCGSAAAGLPPPINLTLLQFLPPSVSGRPGANTIPDRPMDWSSLRTNVPMSIAPQAWEAIWMNYTNAAGATMYSFFGMLEQNVNYLYRLGVLGATINQIDDLLAFEMAQADGLHMLRTLATATDGYAPTPALRLSFDRSFPNSISGRYRLGALGRGWSHNWEERLAKDEYGDVTVFGPGGSQRTFKPDVRGGYLSGLGDSGQLLALPGGAFSVREKGGLVKQFLPDGKLDAIVDPNGNRITCAYTGERLTSLAHSSGQRLGLAYNAAGRIETVTDTIGRTTRLTYDASGEHLASAEYYDGRVLRYGYATGQGAQSENALTEIEFPDQSHQYFSYDAHQRPAERLDALVLQLHLRRTRPPHRYGHPLRHLDLRLRRPRPTHPRRPRLN